MSVRGTDGRVFGILIDTENALWMAHAKSDGMRVCTGTRPFMSINNLVAADVRRSRADDLESVLYTLIWEGVWGASEEYRSNTAKLRPKVAKWSDPSAAARQKRFQMCNTHSLGTITWEFYNNAKSFLPNPPTSEDTKAAQSINDSYVFLKKLLRKLRDDLFDNPNVSCYARGTLSVGADYFQCLGAKCTCPGMGGEPDVINGEIDPFRERAKEGVEREICNKFAATIKECAIESQRIIDASEEVTGMPEGSSKVGGSAPVDDTDLDDVFPPPPPAVG
ncbi:hypothetical protein H4R19_005798 [Coemansia spiralis]|nr:hypothetical protein H4R19_005798 [Coemansia spiralis]